MTPRQKFCAQVTHRIDAATDNPAVIIKESDPRHYIECTLSENERPGRAPQHNTTRKVTRDIAAIMRATRKADIDAERVHSQKYAKRTRFIHTPEASAARAR